MGSTCLGRPTFPPGPSGSREWRGEHLASRVLNEAFFGPFGFPEGLVQPFGRSEDHLMNDVWCKGALTRGPTYVIESFPLLPEAIRRSSIAPPPPRSSTRTNDADPAPTSALVVHLARGPAPWSGIIDGGDYLPATHECQIAELDMTAAFDRARLVHEGRSHRRRPERGRPRGERRDLLEK